MTESSAEVAAIPTVQITLRLPILNPGDTDMVSHVAAISHVQHMLNDFDRWAGREVLLNETGEYGDQTRDRVLQFQKDNHISGPTGGVEVRTWKALLQKWLPVDEASTAG
jgi:Putative peptidoglycan binding domain